MSVLFTTVFTVTSLMPHLEVQVIINKWVVS